MTTVSSYEQPPGPATNDLETDRVRGTPPTGCRLGPWRAADRREHATLTTGDHRYPRRPGDVRRLRDGRLVGDSSCLQEPQQRRRHPRADRCPQIRPALAEPPGREARDVLGSEVGNCYSGSLSCNLIHHGHAAGDERGARVAVVRVVAEQLERPALEVLNSKRRTASPGASA